MILNKITINWVRNYWRMRKFISLNKEEMLNREENKECKEYVITIMPWDYNIVPWYSIALAIILHSKGHLITLLVDDTFIENKNSFRLQLRHINKIVKLLPFTTVYLSSYNNRIDDNEYKLYVGEIENLAFANAVHKNRGEDDSIEFHKFHNEFDKTLKETFRYVFNFIKSNSSKCYIIPGGIYGNTGIFYTLCKQMNLDFFTYDSGFSVLLSTYRGIAAQYSDIGLSLQKIKELDSAAAIDMALYKGKDEMKKRRNGTNKLNSQYQDYHTSETFENVGFLVPLNSPWDAAALNIASAFRSYNEWLLGTIDIILQHTDKHITIRQHPDERFWWGKTKTDFNEMIINKFGNDERIQFVSCFDKVNSYALLEKAVGVVCYSSTFGIEAAIINKPIAACSKTYYSNLGFTYPVHRQSDLIEFVKEVEKISLSKRQLNDALLTYYLGQSCSWLFTIFAPTIDDFKKWSKMTIVDIQQLAEIKLYLESLENCIPLSYITHKSNTKSSIPQEYIN